MRSKLNPFCSISCIIPSHYFIWSVRMLLFIDEQDSVPHIHIDYMFHFLQMDASHNSRNCSNAWRLSCVYPWPQAYFGWLSTRDLCLMRKRVNLLDWLVRWKNDSRVKLQTIGVAECVSVILDGEISVGWGIWCKINGCLPHVIFHWSLCWHLSQPISPVHSAVYSVPFSTSCLPC